MDREANFQFKNSSIMMGCTDFELEGGVPGLCKDKDIDQLGAIFYTSDTYRTFKHDDSEELTADEYDNTAIDLSNVILGGIGLWDLDSQQKTLINSNNAQGCTQMISSMVQLSSKSRFNRCAYASYTTEMPEPSSLVLFSLALLGLGRMKSSR